MIVNIENLDRFPNLKYLDLSFNQIETVQGLEQLTALEDLSLYHNKIQVVSWEKIEMLQNL